MQESGDDIKLVIGNRLSPADAMVVGAIVDYLKGEEPISMAKPPSTLSRNLTGLRLEKIDPGERTPNH